MKNYVGIDLGTTNSAICLYDGEKVRICKSPEQNDVTPSAIFIDKRGNRYYGAKAYNQAPNFPNNTATGFKRLMGTNEKFRFASKEGVTLTPEECSAEILKVLYGYLPEEIRNDRETATVITVPAAFNQMQKNATLEAAKLAGISNVALMQEPVAAIMSVMLASKQNGIFLVYDLGGGTFDISVAESTNGKVNLLAHGGKQMCGGRDIDRAIFDNVVVPWLENTFSLPYSFATEPKYKKLRGLAMFETERTKIELSSREKSSINAFDIGTEDESGEELYVDVEVSRSDIDDIITNIVDETVKATKETLQKAGISLGEVEKIVFVGGPTNYKPLRDKVAAELGIATDTNVNPMTAVAEGASIFAESIDWSMASHNRKSVNDTITTSIDLSFRYEARTSGNFARVMCLMKSVSAGATIQITSKDTGWISGRSELKNNLIINLPLKKNGKNVFGVEVFDKFGRTVPTGVSEIVITKTLATIGAIPASHSVGVEVLDKLGGVPKLGFIVNEGDALPKKGSITFRAGQTLKPGSYESLNIKLWEGNIQDPISDNRFIGVLKVSGQDIDSVVYTGADIECEYEMSDSGTINIEVTIPSIGATFTGRNFYSRKEGNVDISDVDNISEQGEALIKRIDDMEEKIGSDPRLDEAREKAEFAANINCEENTDPETVQKAVNEMLEAKKLISQVREDNLAEMQRMELEEVIELFDEIVRKYATPAEEHSFDNLAKSAQRAIERRESTFANIKSSMRSKVWVILYKQDWFIIDHFRRMTENSSWYTDRNKFYQLKELGERAVADDRIDVVRDVISELYDIMSYSSSFEDSLDKSNILKG